LFLGARVDTESNGAPSADATGDDTRGTPDDEDGVTIGALVRGTNADITVVASQAGYLDAWIDWDGNGVWEADERIHASRAVAAGTTVLSVPVPATAKLGTSYARFRLSNSATPLEPTGTAAAGEVEDYQVQIVEPVRLVGRTIVAQGGPGDDVFSFTPGTTHIVTLNGVAYKFAASLVDAIQLDGGGPGDHDQVFLNGTAARETVELWQDHGTMAGTGYVLTATAMEQFVATSGGGDDLATLHGTAGDDRLEAWSTHARLTNTAGLNLAAYGFAQVVADSHGFATTNDKAFLYGTPGDDNLDAAPNDARLWGAGYSNRALNFRMVTAISDGSGIDTATFTDRAVLSDTFSASPTLASMSGVGQYYNAAVLFDRVEGRATSGNDRARLYDSAQGADSLRAWPTVVELSGAFGGQAYQAKASAFRYVDVFGDAAGAGADTAELHGSTGADTFTARSTESVLSGPGYSVRVTSFETVSAFGEGGSDVARLYDGAGSDTFVARPGWGQMTGPGPNGAFTNTASGFAYVFGYATENPATTDTAELRGSTGSDGYSGNDTFVGEGPVAAANQPAYGALTPSSGVAYYLRATGFDQLTAKGQGGTDTAILRDSDSALPDVLTSRPDLGFAQMEVAGLFLNRVEGFRNVYGFSARGTARDEARLYGAAGADTLTALPTEASLLGADYTTRVYNFERLWAYGTDETVDAATLYDSALRDELTDGPDWVRLAGLDLDYVIEAHKFRTVRPKSQSAADGDVTQVGNFLRDLILTDWQ
jgi:hypothetical protein